jgi:hypothetical protein
MEFRGTEHGGENLACLRDERARHTDRSRLDRKGRSLNAPREQATWGPGAGDSLNALTSEDRHSDVRLRDVVCVEDRNEIDHLECDVWGW